MDPKAKELLSQMVRDLRVRITLLNSGVQVLPLFGKPIGGELTLSGDGSYRRSGSVVLSLTDETVDYNLERNIWFNKEVKVEIGLADRFSETVDDIYWFNVGIMTILSITFDRQVTGRTASLTLGDLMAKLDGSIAGQIGTQVEIFNEGVSIQEAIKQTAAQLGDIDIHNIEVDGSPATLPYTIEQSPGSTVLDLLQTLRDLYKGYELFFDQGGVLVCQEMKTKEYDQLAWDFSEDKDLRVTNSNNASITNIKNSFEVWGRILETGKQVYWRYRNRFLRHHISKNVNRDYFILDIPFTMELGLEQGDICHIKDPASAKTIYEISKDETYTEENKFKEQLINKERSYVWTNYFNFSEELQPDENGVVRLSHWCSDRFKVAVKAVDSSTSSQLVANLRPDLSTRGETGSRYYQIRDLSTWNVEQEVLTPLSELDRTQFTASHMFNTPSNIKVYVDGVEVTTGFYGSNREGLGRVFFAEIVPENSVVTVSYEARTLEGLVYDGAIIATYEYETKEKYWMELDFLVVPEFRSELIGERVFSERSDEYFNTEQAKSKVKYDLWRLSNFAETVDLQTLPLYHLQPNTKIRLKDEKIGVDGDYSISSLSVPLSPEGLMSIQATKVQNSLGNIPEARTSLPEKAPLCMVNSYLYPENFKLRYTVELDGANTRFTATTVEMYGEVVFLTENDFDVLYARVEALPFQIGPARDAFLEKAKYILKTLAFEDSAGKTALESKQEFVEQFIGDDLIYNSILSAPSTYENYWESPGENTYITNEHFIGGNSGLHSISYNLGQGNTYDRLRIFPKVDPPANYFRRQAPVTPEYAEQNFPLEELILPPRFDYKEHPTAETKSAYTLGFIKDSGTLYNLYNFYPFEYDIQTEVVSHFCANIRKTAEDLIRTGKWNISEGFPLDEFGDPQPLVRADRVYLGLIPSKDVKIDFVLGMGNTEDKFEIFSNTGQMNFDLYDESGALIQSNVSSVSHNPNDGIELRGSAKFDWNPINAEDQFVTIQITSSLA